MSSDIRGRPPRAALKRQKEPGSARSEDSSRGTTSSTRSSTPLTRCLEPTDGRAALLGGPCLKVDDLRSEPPVVAQPKASAMHSSFSKLSEPPLELSDQTKSEMLKAALDTLKALNKSSGGRRAHEGRESHVHQVYDGIFRHSSAVEELAWQQLFRAREFPEGSTIDEEEERIARAVSPVNTRCRANYSADAWKAFRNGRGERWLPRDHIKEPVSGLLPRSAVSNECSAQPIPANCENDSEIASGTPGEPPEAPSAFAIASSLFQDEMALVPSARRSGQGFERPAAGPGSAAVRRHGQGKSPPPPPPGSCMRLPPRPGTWNEGTSHAAQPWQMTLDHTDLNVRGQSHNSPPTSAPAAPCMPDSVAFTNTFPRSSSDCWAVSDSALRSRMTSWSNEGGGNTDNPGLPSLTGALAIVSGPEGIQSGLELPSCSQIDTATSNLVQSPRLNLTNGSTPGSRSSREARTVSESTLSPLRIVGTNPLSTQCRGGSLPLSGNRQWIQHAAPAVTRCSA